MRKGITVVGIAGGTITSIVCLCGELHSGRCPLVGGRSVSHKSETGRRWIERPVGPDGWEWDGSKKLEMCFATPAILLSGNSLERCERERVEHRRPRLGSGTREHEMGVHDDRVGSVEQGWIVGEGGEDSPNVRDVSLLASGSEMVG